LAILNGAQNPDAALHFIDFCINAVGDTSMQMVNRGYKDYGFTPMTGRTNDSAEFLTWWADFIEGEYARFEKTEYYDWAYYEACLEYWDNLPVKQGAYHGWRSSYFEIPTHKVMIDYPPATAVSMYIEELQAMLDEHNDFIRSR